MHKKFDSAFAQRVMGVIAGVSAIYAFLSVEAVSMWLCEACFRSAGATSKVSLRRADRGGAGRSRVYRCVAECDGVVYLRHTAYPQCFTLPVQAHDTD